MTSWIRLSLLLLLFPKTNAAHSRRRPVVRREAESRYDRSITTFSADGRLKQVEYGMEASRRGQTVAAFCSSRVAVLAVKSKVYRIDAHVLLVTSGLVGDGRALASNLRTACQNFRLTNGEAPTLREVSRHAAQVQHDLTRMGGYRPLGCTAFLVGVSGGEPKLFQTEPGGIVEECRYCAGGKGREKAMEALMQLDEETVSTREESEEMMDEEPSLVELVERVAQAALKEALEDTRKDEETLVDVWIVQSSENHRGGTRFMCIKNVSSENIEKIREHLSPTSDEKTSQ